MTALACILLCLTFFGNSAERDSAAHALAITETNDHAYIFPENDSLIRYATAYYDRHGTRAERAKAHFYLGCVEADLFRRAEAIYEIRQAERLNPDKENRLQALVYSRLGYLLYEHNLTEEAKDIYTKAEQLALLQHDTIDLIYSRMQLGRPFEAWQLAVQYKDREDVRPTVLTALYNHYKETGMTDSAYYAAQLCMSLVPRPMKTWPAMFNLGEALYMRGEFDSAKVLLEPVLHIDHSYQMRADAAAILENIAIREQRTEQAAMYADLHKALQRSAYTALETNNVLRRQLYELEEQAEERQRQKHVLAAMIAILILLIGIAMSVIIQRWRQHRSLYHKIQSMKTIRRSLVQETFETSDLHSKLQHITDAARENPFTKENLDNSDWQQLLVYTDERYHGIVTHLRCRYNLTEDELHICVLMLADVPVSLIGHFVRGYTRNTIQLKARQIPQNAGAPKGTLLRQWLQEEIDSLNS